MIAIGWVDFSRTEVDETRTEMRNGVLCHKLIHGLPVAKAVNWANDESPEMWKRAESFARTMDDGTHKHVTVLWCDELQEVKDAVLAKIEKEN